MRRFISHLLASIILAPIATFWVKFQEKRICTYGSALTKEQHIWAHAVGIQHPQKICIVREPALAFPAPRHIAQFFEKRGMGLSKAAGMSLRYGIFISSETTLSQHLLCHELTHTLQYERLGSIYSFLRQYLFECIYYGYSNSAMEKEADQLAHTICKAYHGESH